MPTAVLRTGYLGLGSNLGDRRANLQAAVDALGHHGVAVVASSSVYDTEPVGELLDQPEFLNACVRIQTALEPLELLDACKSVERELGRAPGGPRHAPRPIDVDVLLLGTETLSHPRLRLPHAEVTARRFVMVPLLELEPELRTPDGTAIAVALGALGAGEQAVRVAGPPLDVPLAPPTRRCPGFASLCVTNPGHRLPDCPGRRSAHRPSFGASR